MRNVKPTVPMTVRIRPDVRAELVRRVESGEARTLTDAVELAVMSAPASTGREAPRP